MTETEEDHERRGPKALDADDAVDIIETEMALLARNLFRQHHLHFELDRASYLLARTLEDCGPVTIGGLAGILGLDQTTVTRQVSAMESAGLVTRRPDPNDGRSRLVRLSGKGRRSMLADRAHRRSRVADQLADWTDDERLQLGRLLEKFNETLIRDSLRRSSS